MTDFNEYIIHGETGQKEKANVWQTMNVLGFIVSIETYIVHI